MVGSIDVAIFIGYFQGNVAGKVNGIVNFGFSGAIENGSG